MASNENDCKEVVMTKYGQLVIVDMKKSYQDAKTFCEEGVLGKLPALNNKTMINDILSYMHTDCSVRGQKWHIGLKTEHGVGNWSDGKPYDYDQHEDLFTFGIPVNHKECQTAILSTFHEDLITDDDCREQLPFLCLRDATVGKMADETFYEEVYANESAIAEVGNKTFHEFVDLGDTTSSPVVGGDVGFDVTTLWNIIIILVVLVAVLLFLLAFPTIRRVVKKSEKKGMSVLYIKDEVLLQEDEDKISQI